MIQLEPGCGWRMVCEALGVPFGEGARPDGRLVPWDGERMWQTASGASTVAMPEADLWHELGHWLVATEAQRRHCGFGLGAAYDRFSSSTSDGPVTTKIDVEPDASALGIWLQHRFGGEDEAVEHAIAHSWGDWRAGHRRLTALPEALKHAVEKKSAYIIRGRKRLLEVHVQVQP